MKARKGCGPYNLGAPKGVGKKYAAPTKQVKGKINPNLSAEEKKLLDTDALSDSRLQQLRGKRGPEFHNTLKRLRAEQRAQDSTYIVKNRTFREQRKTATGMSGTVTLSEGTSRPSKFKRDRHGNIKKY